MTTGGLPNADPLPGSRAVTLAVIAAVLLLHGTVIVTVRLLALNIAPLAVMTAFARVGPAPQPNPSTRPPWNTTNAATYATAVMLKNMNSVHFHELVSRRTTASVDMHWHA